MLVFRYLYAYSSSCEVGRHSDGAGAGGAGAGGDGETLSRVLLIHQSITHYPTALM